MPEFTSEDGPDGSTRTIRTETLQLHFRWDTDRWFHDISVRTGQGWRRVAFTPLRGFLPPGRPNWVHDPAYQQFHHQAERGRAFALLVGQSGPHHLSASFQIDEADAVSRITVDVADRVRVAEPGLACTYFILQDASDAIIEGPARIAWNLADLGRLTLSSAAPSDRDWRIDIAGVHPTDKVHLSRIVIVEEPKRAAPSLRCRYHWTFENSNVCGSQPS